jgi:carboxypeptidase PM20D1
MTDRAVAKLQALVRIATISDRDPARVDGDAFDRLLVELHQQFPVLHDRLELTRVGTHGLLFCWPGRAHDKPLVLMAHLDVVPVDDSAPWQHPPFAGEVADEAVWGRGTLDDKGCVTAICEAVERLLESGHEPAQDVWLSFGCDEEVSGTAAVAAVDELQRRGVRPWLVLDEGGAIAHDAFPGVRRPVAAIGVAEKGTTSVELRVEGRGGHASTPARNGPTVRLARAVLRIDRSPMPARLPDTTLELVRRLTPHLPAPLRPLLGRPDRIRPLLTKALTTAGAETAAMARTTFAVTTLQGSPALNVIASSATAGVNIRVMPGDTVDDVLTHLRRVVDDAEVRILVVERGEASPVSPVDDVFEVVAALVEERFPDAIVTPYVQAGATDSRHFTRICEHVYRFVPFRMDAAQRRAIHSYDEHLGIAAFLEGIEWYGALIERLPE